MKTFLLYFPAGQQKITRERKLALRERATDIRLPQNTTPVEQTRNKEGYSGAAAAAQAGRVRRACPPESKAANSLHLLLNLGFHPLHFWNRSAEVIGGDELHCGPSSFGWC